MVLIYVIPAGAKLFRRSHYFLQLPTFLQLSQYHMIMFYIRIVQAKGLFNSFQQASKNSLENETSKTCLKIKTPLQ